MGANIALLRYLYDNNNNTVYLLHAISPFDRKRHVNEQAICNLYKIHSDSEQFAIVGVLGI